MSKVKQWAEDMAEEYLDELIKNVKNKVLTVAQAVDEAREKDVNWDLIGFDSEDDLYCYLADMLNEKGMVGIH